MLKASLQYTNPLIDYDILLMQNNDRDLPDTSLISTNQQAIKDNDEQIQFKRQKVGGLGPPAPSDESVVPHSHPMWH